MLKENLEQLFEFIAQHIPSEKIMEAKEEYQKTTGKIYEDDKSYDTRMALFLEWYLLDNYVSGTHNTILENIIEENLSIWTHDRLEIHKDISNSIQALFEVKKVRDKSVTVLDLFKDEKHIIDEEDSQLVFRKNDIFQGRIVPNHGKWYFTGYFCFHPSKTQRYIRCEVKKIFLLQKSWKKELATLEKGLLKKQKVSLKNSKCIEKIKSKIERRGFDAKRENLIKELLVLEEKGKEIETSTRETDKKIDHLKIETIKIEGRRLISELINRLAYMNLKWERSRQIKISDIYKN